jgi:hypothetical protein
VLKLVIPEKLPTSPLSIFCPYCGAKPGEDCESVTEVVGVVHLSRIAAAAAIDALNLDIRNENRGGDSTDSLP